MGGGGRIEEGGNCVETKEGGFGRLSGTCWWWGASMVGPDRLNIPAADTFSHQFELFHMVINSVPPS